MELEEVMRIEESKGFDLISPYNIKISKKGDLFVQDRQQLLQFDLSGRFVRNYLSIGEGPGEVVSISNYQLTPEGLIVHGSPPKLLIYDYDGRVTKEIPIRARVLLTSFQLFRGGHYFFLEADWSKLGGNEKIVEIPLNLYSLEEDGESFTRCASFPVRYFFAQAGGERAIIQVDKLISAAWGTYLAISNTPEYMISLFDADDEQVIRKISRDYRRLKDTTSDGGPIISLGGKTYGQPKKDFKDDIQGFMVSDDRLWVINSATEEKSGLHIDVFDEGGTVRDSFVLRFKGGFPPKVYDKYQIASDGRYIYAVMAGPNDLFFIGKYRLPQ